MELKQLGKSNVKVTPLAFGAWAIGGWMWGGADEKAAIQAIQTAFHEGITTIDTAPVYGFGKSEELVGKALHGIARDKYQILTKFGMNWETAEGEYFFDTKDLNGNPLKIYKNGSPKQIRKEIERSLQLLKTDYVDLYQIHWPDATTPIAETMETLNDLVKEGKILAAGVCNYNTQLVDEALKTIQLATNQVPYRLINRNIEKDVIPQAMETGLSIIPYSPLQRGLLTGKIKPGYQFNDGDTREGSTFYSDKNIIRTNELLEKIKPIAEQHQASLSQVIINWTVNQPGIGCVLAGARNASQVKDNAAALSFTLSTDELQFITNLADQFILAD
jgi:aryl-alcohol dehydrogenase-like predicted oxidoreductase